MDRGLFRKEVLDSKRTGGMGSISLAQPVNLRVLSATATLSALLVALYLTFGTYTRRTGVTGHLVPSQGLATVLAPATGFVSRINVAEGSKVKAGQVLATLTVPRATLASGETANALRTQIQRRQQGLESARTAQEHQFFTKAAGLSAQIRAAQAELQSIETEIATRRDQVRIAHETLERLRQLRDGKYVSLLQIKQQESMVLEQVGTMQGLQRQTEGVQRTIAQLSQSLSEIPSQRSIAEAEYLRDTAQLEQEHVETNARGALAVTSPVSGVVATQVAKAGQSIREEQPLLTLLSGDGKLEAELLVPSRAVGFIEPGHSVFLRYEAYPYQKFGHQKGDVVRISRSALRPDEITALTNIQAGNEPFYRVTVALSRQAVIAYGKVEPLKPGMLLEADIMGERRRLIEWVFEPLYSLNGRLRDK